jgi:Na+/phosphate symporter
LWFAVDLRQGLRRAQPGRRLRAALAAGEHWFGFFIAWAVLAQLIYLFIYQALADPGQRSVWTWLSVTLVTVLGSAVIVALTVIWPGRRARRRSGRRSRLGAVSAGVK